MSFEFSFIYTNKLFELNKIFTQSRVENNQDKLKLELLKQFIESNLNFTMFDLTSSQT